MAQPGDLVLRMTRTLPAPRPRVFEALTEPEDLGRWWGPEGFTTPGIELDLREGGSYRFGMQPPDGELFHLTGEFQEVDPPRQLSYTFRWEPPDTDDRETLVTLTLQDSAPKTEIQLTQEGFATEGRYELHHDGWTDSFDRLTEMMAAEAG